MFFPKKKNLLLFFYNGHENDVSGIQSNPVFSRHLFVIKGRFVNFKLNVRVERVLTLGKGPWQVVP